MVDIDSKIEQSKEKIPTREKIGQPEIVKTPEKEKGLEDIYEQTEPVPEQTESQAVTEKSRGDIIGIGNQQSAYQQRQKMIEDTLARGLEDEFLKMSSGEQLQFKRVGEETAARINEMLSSTKVKAKKIIELIKKWLFMIPGVNKFFVEQEAKIKTDEIIKLNKLPDQDKM